MTIPDEAIEAAAKALRKKFNGYEVAREWDSRDQRTTYRNDAVAALEAAAPHMLASKEAPHRITIGKLGDEGYGTLMGLISDIAASNGRSVIYIYPEAPRG